jgi:hypothetical protein
MAAILLNSILVVGLTVADPVAELKEMQQRLARALLSQQRDEYASMLAPEWRVTHIDGQVLTKAQVLDMVFNPAGPPFTEASEDDIEVRMLGDSVGVVTGRSTFKLRDNSQLVLRFTDVVHRRDGKWLVVASHASLVSSPKP